MAAQSLVDGKLMSGWLRDMGCKPKSLPDPALNWRFEVEFPPGRGNRLNIFSTKELPRAAIVATRAVMSPEHIGGFSDLDDDAKKEFIQQLMDILNREYVEFQLEGIEGGGCPTAFQVMAIRYDDGLTLDSLARTMSSVFKTQLAAVSHIQRHLGGNGPATGGMFEFKKLGVQ